MSDKCICSLIALLPNVGVDCIPVCALIPFILVKPSKCGCWV